MRPWKALGVALVLVLVGRSALAQLGVTVPNWGVPSSGGPGSSGGRQGITTQSDLTPGIGFVAVTPCRVVDTRAAAGPFGGPALAVGSPRSFAIPSGPCAGIPTNAGAYSLNVTVTNTQGAGFILMYPQGGTQPVVSTLNYSGVGQTVANAAVVPAGTAGPGGITVAAGAHGTNLIIDINGYYSANLNATTQFVVTGSVDDDGVIKGTNDSTADQASGVVGVISSTTPGENSAGVVGISSGTGNNGQGIWGIHSGNGFGVVGESDGTAGANARGVFGFAYSTADGSAGIEGDAFGETGANFGVLGLVTSIDSDSAGVRGIDGTGSAGVNGLDSAGVRGESLDSQGVLGVSQTTGVAGELYDETGAFVAGGYLGAAFGTATDATGGPWGVFAHGNLGAFGAKHFVEPHPTDPASVITYSSLEGREVGTYFRGTAQTVGGRAVIAVPEDFRIVTDEDGLTVQLTPLKSFASMYVESEGLDAIVVHSSKDVTFHYLVQGVRRAFKEFQPVGRGSEFVPRSAAARMPAGLTAEARRRLIANGTYRQDGTVNLETAAKMGWTEAWAARERQKKLSAAAATTARPQRPRSRQLPLP